jgi:hypothetical protein
MSKTKQAEFDVETPWERQPGESSKAFGKFSFYRDLGPTRSLTQVAREFRCSVSGVKELSARWSWAYRVQAWDSRLDQDKRAKMAEQAEASVERIFQSADNLVRMGIACVAQKDASGEYVALTDEPKEGLRLFKAGAEVILRLCNTPGGWRPSKPVTAEQPQERRMANVRLIAEEIEELLEFLRKTGLEADIVRRIEDAILSIEPGGEKPGAGTQEA